MVGFGWLDDKISRMKCDAVTRGGHLCNRAGLDGDSAKHLCVFSKVDTWGGGPL